MKAISEMTRCKDWRLTFALTILALLCLLSLRPGRAQQRDSAAPENAAPARYTVTDLGKLVGGTSSQAFFANNKGLVSGVATLPDATQHAVLWQKGLITDIGIPGLGGPNSIAFGDNERGQAVGEAETSTLDPNGEDFCGFGTHLICLPFLWQHGVMTPLPTLGGNNGATGTIFNNRGEVAGWAENTTPDPACPAPQALQFKPVIWEKGEVQELPTFPGDPDGVAFGINDNGQVVGSSGSCTTFSLNTFTNLLPLHALLWQKGTVTDLGNLGGTMNNNIAFAVNNQGQVVGLSDLQGDTTFHAFLWQNGVMTDLGTLPGDVASVALGINDRGKVVGVSLDASFNLRPFLRQNGVMTDLNALIPADSPLLLLIAEVINSRGEIVGSAIQTSTGELHAFLATPSNGRAATESFSPASQGVTRPMVLREDVRNLLQQRLHVGRFGVRLKDPQ